MVTVKYVVLQSAEMISKVEVDDSDSIQNGAEQEEKLDDRCISRYVEAVFSIGDIVIGSSEHDA